jgi:hypothetical protein
MSALLADAILVLHFGFVAFVVGSLPLIWIGAWARWSWVRHRGYRLAHFAAILFVTAESLLGMMCPLTVWEDALRGVRHDQGLIARWLHRVMYYELPENVFILAYAAYAVLVAVTFYVVPPRRASRRGGTAG